MKPFRIALAVTLALLAGFLPEAEPPVRAGLALFVLTGTLWVTEAMPLTYTALLVPVVAAALGLGDIPAVLSGFAHPVIGLFLGGFALAAALTSHGIDRWLAGHLLSLAGGRPVMAALLLGLTTAFLSMWISNTATAAMMLPIAMGLVAPLDQAFPRYRLFLMLCLAWGANIGGIGTLVGSPPNAIAAGALGIGFREWMMVGLPVVALLLPVAPLVLWMVFRPEPGVPRLDTETRIPFPRGRGPKVTVVIFLLTVTLWVAGAPLSSALEIEKNFDTWVALLALALLGMTGTLRWPEMEHHTNWGVLLLFGGGLTLGTLVTDAGTSLFIAEGLREVLPGDNRWLFFLLVAVAVILMSELMSNTATAALMIPLMMPVAAAMGFGEEAIALVIAVAASCVFMLPVATPPNAMVFGTGMVPQKRMIRAGLPMDLICALGLSSLLAWWLGG